MKKCTYCDHKFTDARKRKCPYCGTSLISWKNMEFFLGGIPDPEPPLTLKGKVVTIFFLFFFITGVVWATIAEKLSVVWFFMVIVSRVTMFFDVLLRITSLFQKRQIKIFVSKILPFTALMYCLVAWFLGYIITYNFWRIPGIIIGTLLAGVGFIPIGAVISLLRGDWKSFFILILLIFLSRWAIISSDTLKTQVTLMEQAPDES